MSSIVSIHEKKIPQNTFGKPVKYSDIPMALPIRIVYANMIGCIFEYIDINN